MNGVAAANDALGQVAGTGIVGALLVLALVALWWKDRQLEREKHSRIEDAKAFNTLALAMQREVITAVQKLSELVEIWEKREADRERTERVERRAR